ncbi:hypothetical protein KAI87_15125, partial [Myxococcota bacterium]|nr:hypothetical protein [Myxococcota bacterium]
GMFTFWSGMEKMLQGIVFLLGIKFGGTKTHKRAERFLRILQWLGKGGDTTGDICLELIVRGEKDGSPKEQHLSLHSSEEYATAIAPAIVCKQLASGMLSAKGAFLPPQVVLVDDAIEALRGFEVHFEEHSA